MFGFYEESFLLTWQSTDELFTQHKHCLQNGQSNQRLHLTRYRRILSLSVLPGQ